MRVLGNVVIHKCQDCALAPLLLHACQLVRVHISISERNARRGVHSSSVLSCKCIVSFEVSGRLKEADASSRCYILLSCGSSDCGLKRSDR